MKLVGQYDSPYTRRVAISLQIQGFEFEQLPLSLFADYDEMLAINPLVRIPSLILDGGEVLIDSAAILDWLNEQAGTDKALIPACGKPRREAMQIIAVATGSIDKAVAISYERFRRPKDKIYAPWIERLTGQLSSALTHLNTLPQTPWLMGDALSQADISTASMIGYIRLYLPDLFSEKSYTNLEALAQNCEKLPAFKACLPKEKDIGGDMEDAKKAILRLQGR